MTSRFDSGLRARVEALGSALTPELLTRSQGIYAPLQRPISPGELIIERELAYGGNERQRLDVLRQQADALRPALVFVHGGGFVGGEKTRPGLPFYENVAVWAARVGLVGVNMTYRLAPAHPWPAGAEDVSAALAFLVRHAQDHGIDPHRIWVAGQSAGAAHVASAFALGLAREAAGAILISGLYELTIADPRAISQAYYGSDPAAFEARSSAKGVAASNRPVLIAAAENDPRHFQQQSLALANAIFDVRRSLPRFITMAGHNHITGILHLGLPGDRLGPEILDVIETEKSKTDDGGRRQ